MYGTVPSLEQALALAREQPQARQTHSPHSATMESHRRGCLTVREAGKSVAALKDALIPTAARTGPRIHNLADGLAGEKPIPAALKHQHPHSIDAGLGSERQSEGTLTGVEDVLND